ncbi:MAG: hypothetical protein ACOX20_12525 [Limnochordia bacterium]
MAIYVHFKLTTNMKLPMVCPKCYGKTHHHGNYHRKVWLGGHEVILIKVFGPTARAAKSPSPIHRLFS